MTVGQKIAARRAEKQLTMEQLAEKIGKKTPAIYKYENDMVDIPLSVLKALHYVLDISYMELLEDDDSEDANLLKAYHRLEEPKKEVVRDILHLPDMQKTPASSTG